MKRNYYIVALIMLTFFVISFITNILGPADTRHHQGFNLSLTLVALLPFAFFIAYGVMSIPSGMLIEKYNEKKMMIVAFIVSFVGSLLLALFPNYLTAVLSFLLLVVVLPCSRLLSIRCYARQEAKNIMHLIPCLPN